MYLHTILGIFRNFLLKNSFIIILLSLNIFIILLYYFVFVIEMKLLPLAICLVVLLFQTSLSEEESGWSWGDKEEKKEEKIEGRHNIDQSVLDSFVAETGFEEEQTLLNDTQVEGLINDILSSTRQGRNLQGYDEVYTDPDVQDALQKGDESEARNVIKERLCSLGLMSVSKIKN